MISKRSPNRTKINITSQTAVSFYIRMFSDRFASLFHLSVLRKSCKSLVRVIKFEGVASSPRALTCERHLKRSEQKSTKQCRQIDAETVQKGAHFDTSSQNASEVATELKKAAPTGPRGCPRRVPERPWSVPGRSLEHPRSALGAPKSPPKRPECVQGVSEGPSGHHFGSIWTSKWRSGSPFGHKKELRFPLQDHHLASNILCFTEGVRANVVRSKKGRRVSRSVPTRAHKRTAAHATTRRRKDAFRSCLFRCNVM